MSIRLYKIARYDDWEGLYENNGNDVYKNIYENHDVIDHVIDISSEEPVMVLEIKEVNYDWFEKYYNTNGFMPNDWNDIKFND